MDPLLEAILERRKSGETYQGGIVLASDHLRFVIPCLDEAACNLSLHEDATSEQWMTAVKEAGVKLVHSNDDCRILGGKSDSKLFGDSVELAELTPGACLDYTTIMTSINEDRDEDILHPKGANLDQRMPLLYHHNPVWPIGKFVKEIRRTDQLLEIKNSIADTVMGRDAAQLAEFGALRTSHGFRAKKFKQRKSGGYEITEYDVFESSLVPVPANSDAVITLTSRGKLHHPVNKSWGEQLKSQLPKSVVGGFEKKEEKVCGCDQKEAFGLTPKELAVPARQSYDGTLWVGVCLAGSWEWVTEELCQKAKKFLEDAGEKMPDGARACVIGTFSDSAIVAVFSYYSESESTVFYRCNWTMSNGEPEFSGDPNEVKLAVQVTGEPSEEKSAAALKSMVEELNGSKVPKKIAAQLRRARELMHSVRNSSELVPTTKASADAAHDIVHGVIKWGGKSSVPEAVADLRKLVESEEVDLGVVFAIRETLEIAEDRNLSAELAEMSN